MKKSILLGAATLLSCFVAFASQSITSPSGNISLTFNITPNGTPTYSVSYGQRPVVLPSALGLKFTTIDATNGFKLHSQSQSQHRGSWAPVWGENDSIADNYNALTVELIKPSKPEPFKMNIEFRVYNDGIGFRYVLPQSDGRHLTLADEQSQFAMASDLLAWWIPGDYDTQEYEYTRSRLSEIRRHNTVDDKVGNVSQTSFSPTGVQTSLMLKDDSNPSDPLYINLHEAAVVDYPAMHLDLNDASMVFTSWLTPNAQGNKAEITLPFSTPWRAIMISDKATDILASDLIYNLNEPLALDDTSWIHPTKYMGVWWEMITGKSSWAYTDAENFDLATFDYSKATPNGRHAANNENVRRYIDFAADNGFDQLLIEGWNIGWEDWFGKEKDFVFDFVTPYPDFDIKALNDYAHSRGIRLMMHHETSGSIPNYERHMDQAYSLMNHYGYDAVKSGYVGNILPRGENHYNQNSVNHYLNAVRRAADHHIMVNAHEAVRPTGLARTYPNLVGNESAMGTEYRNMEPNHVTILPFTRLKGGPMDFTPGIFRMDIGSFVPGSTEHKKATIANQLALYLTMYSPLQMAADLPEHYAEKMDAFQFIKDVPVDWSRSLYLDAEPGEFIVVARKDKKSADWYVGGVTGFDARTYDLSFSFLPAGTTYRATIYADAPDADYLTNPEAYEISTADVSSATTLPIRMARGGGFAIRLQPLTK